MNKNEILIAFLAAIFSIVSIFIAFQTHVILAYGDAESHLNIAKRVVDGVTPGVAQLGAVWLPLPHLMMIPFVIFDPLWRSGLAGSIVSGISFVITAIFLYKLIFLLAKNNLAAIVGTMVFLTNPNMLYIQTTPLTEPILLLFFIGSIYFFAKFTILRDDRWLMLSAFFGFLATITRYDGWFLVAFETIGIVLLYARHRYLWLRMEGRLVLFVSLAFFGIILWFLWNFILVGDPMYFANSIYSAKTQQAAWYIKGELPAYRNLWLSFLYYFLTSLDITGVIIFAFAILGISSYLRTEDTNRFVLTFILVTPFIFYIVSLFTGQAVIFIPSLTPNTFQWQLFNVRYGILMIPVCAFFFGYLFSKSKHFMQYALLVLLVLQAGYFTMNPSSILVLADGVNGLSNGERTADAAKWLTKHYDNGYILMDDYARSMSVIRTDIPMHNVIYVGNRPYYQESLHQPEKYATWIIMQKNDDVWKHLYDNKDKRGELYKYFVKVYTSSDMLIFKRNIQTASVY